MSKSKPTCLEEEVQEPRGRLSSWVSVVTKGFQEVAEYKASKGGNP